MKALQACGRWLEGALTEAVSVSLLLQTHKTSTREKREWEKVETKAAEAGHATHVRPNVEEPGVEQPQAARCWEQDWPSDCGSQMF